MGLDKKTPRDRRMLVLFLTLFIDVVGFSMIFPLFPSMMEWYIKVEANNGLFSKLLHWLSSFHDGDIHSWQTLALFGGVLGSLYSFAQFIAAPLWGAFSDKHGRKPALQLSMIGILSANLLWAFSGNFLLLIISRLFAGLAAGSISTATAAISDITSKEDRTKGMTIAGIALGTAFMFGPAIGGICSIIDLSEYSALLSPFSFTAFAASALALINIIMVAKCFEETLDKENRNKQSVTCLKAILSSTPACKVTIFTNFMVLLVFSGMEFSLVFLANDRLGFGPKENSLIFIVSGIVIILVQGAFVRRYASRVGNDRLILMGILLSTAGMFWIAFIYSSIQIFLALSLLSSGMAMLGPALASTVSKQSLESEQGINLGALRSAGSLGRAIGPFAGGLLYFTLGASMAYKIGAAFLLILLLFTQRFASKSK